ncbi:MAG: DUF362 domain-containing protein [Dehalococcoidia bacterium]|nr:DUF362 domain-containing protein [Dehalococcoidia bacterium]
MSNRVAISRVRDGDVYSAVRDAVGLAGGFERPVAAGSRVLIKPNLYMGAPSGSGLVTDARVVEAVTRLVLSYGPASVVIAEGTMAGVEGEGPERFEALRRTGVFEVGRRLGVEVRNLDTDAFEEIRIPDARAMKRIRIATTVLESDVIISVPVLKTHLRTNVSLSLKNMKGAMVGVENRKSHRIGVDEVVADLNTIIRPHYAIIDAIVGMEGTWQVPDDSREMGLIVAGSDPVYVDVVGAALMNIDPATVMHLQLVAKHEGKRAALSSVNVLGEDLESNRRSFRNAFDVFRSRFPMVSVVLGQGACSGCTAELVIALSCIEKAGVGEQMRGLTVVLGSPSSVTISDRVVAVGDCSQETSGALLCVKGCPPDHRQLIHEICEACHIDESHVLSIMQQAPDRSWASSAPVMP